MREVPKPDLLLAMKDCLRQLEKTKLLNPDDLDILNQKRLLREQIEKLEKKDAGSAPKVEVRRKRYAK